MSDATPSGTTINRIRRRERAVEDDAWIRAYLKEAPFGVVATENDGQPYLTPLNFAYDDDSHAIYFHAARTGRLFTNVAANPRVSFNACRMGAVIPKGRPCASDVEYDSVIVFGRLRLLEDADAAYGLRVLVAKYSPHPPQSEDGPAFDPDQLTRTAVYRLDIDAWSGKRNPGDS